MGRGSEIAEVVANVWTLRWCISHISAARSGQFDGRGEQVQQYVPRIFLCDDCQPVAGVTCLSHHRHDESRLHVIASSLALVLRQRSDLCYTYTRSHSGVMWNAVADCLEQAEWPTALNRQSVRRGLSAAMPRWLMNMCSVLPFSHWIFASEAAVRMMWMRMALVCHCNFQSPLMTMKA